MVRARVAHSARLLAACRRPVRSALLNLSAGSDAARLGGARHQVSAAITARLAPTKNQNGAATPSAAMTKPPSVGPTVRLRL